MKPQLYDDMNNYELSKFDFDIIDLAFKKAIVNTDSLTEKVKLGYLRQKFKNAHTVWLVSEKWV